MTVNSSGAFAFPVTPDSTFGSLTAGWDEVGDQATIDPSEAIVAEQQNQLALEQYLSQLQVVVLSGILNAAGGAQIAHNLTDANRRVWQVGCYYNAFGVAVPFSQPASVDPVNVNLNGGAAGAAFRAVMVLLPQPVGW